MQSKEDIIELYSNKMGSVYQSDKERALIVEFAGTSATLNIPCFLCLKKTIDKIDLDKMASDLSSDLEIITPCACDRCYILTLTEAYYFKDLLSGAKVMIELNSIIHEKLYRFSFV